MASNTLNNLSPRHVDMAYYRTAKEAFKSDFTTKFSLGAYNKNVSLISVPVLLVYTVKGI